MRLIVSYKFICCGLNINAQLIMDTIIDKISSSQFFILYNNINIYKSFYNQQIYNHSSLMNYIVEYIYLMKTSASIDDGNNT